MSVPLISGKRMAHVGLVSATTRGTTVQSHASTNTKGSFVELSSSTPIDADGFYLFIGGGGSSVPCALVDIAIGAAAAEQVIVPNVAFGNLNNRQTYAIYFPVPIPAGTRIAARTQAATGSTNNTFSILLVKGGLLVPGSLGRVVDYGTTLASSRGTVVDPGGSANTKGSYSELTAATTSPIKAILLMVGNGMASGDRTADADWFLDIAIGAAASEQIVAPDIHVAMDDGATGVPGVPQSPFWLPVEIPVGERISVRAQSDVNTDGDGVRDLYVSILGVG